ncbi:MAG: zinc ribbon domain-containing protein [Clostridia bacterium]|nr:zinc ribbon domain-containing protein [Clostridia bacterium]
MSKQCVHCGREIPDDASLCGECGTFQTTDEENAAPGRLKVKITPVKIVAIVIFLITAAALSWLIVSLNVEIKDAGGYTKAMKIQVSVYNGNAGNIKRLAPSEYWTMLKEEFDFDIDEYVADLKEAEKKKKEEAEAAKKAAKESTPAESDSDTEQPETEEKYTYEVISSERFSKKDLKFFNKEMKKTLRSDARQLVTDAYRVKYKIHLFIDDKDEYEEEWDVVSFRIREGWYILKDGRFLIAPSAPDIVIRPEFYTNYFNDYKERSE